MEPIGSFDLQGRTAIVTGSARGIGRAIALGLVNSGVSVLLADTLDTREVQAEIEALGGACLGMKVDITQERETRDMAAAALERFGRIDILVNVAGIIRYGSVEDSPPEDWQAMLAVNLIGPFLCAKAVAPSMKAQNAGKIITIASTGGVAGFPNASGYCSSKGAVISFTKSLAVELAPFKINVNVVSPNVVLTDMIKERFSIAGESDKSLKRIPLGRFLQPEDIVGPVLFLASPAADMITGHNLYVDGGFLAK